MLMRSPERAALFHLVLSLCCLLALAGSAYHLSRAQDASDARVRHTEEVVSHIAQLHQLALDAESTGRAFLVVADVRLRERYDALRAQIDRELRITTDLLTAEPAAAEQLKALKQALDTRFAYLSELMAVRTAQGLDASARIAGKAVGRAEMEHIREALSALKEGQHVQLREHLAERAHAMKRLSAVTAAFVLAGIALALWVYHQTRGATRTRESHDRQKEYMARHDALTGLANRRYLQERLEEQIAEARRSSSVVVVMYLDLDGFKEVNDTLGHDRGDELLIDVARRLRGAVRAGDVVARLGGDEFVISLPHLVSETDSGFVAEKLIAVLSAPYALEGGEARVSASIGVAMFPRDGETPRELLIAADRALYAAKTGGKNRFEWALPARHAATA